ncbi:hypothetical protein AB0G04_28455 [Actinoplanes sp. NPDC023801]|uniref:hypothetical protein n=1 Tax=Actinoplanes sp. NPDC023801 TaxID=3154595 RepID=UPI0033C7348F
MTLILKLVLAPLLVVGSTLAGRRWGDRVAGTLVAFPIVAGPILLIATLQHGTEFGARAASASLFGLVSLAVFAVSFAYLGRRYGWLPSLLLSWNATLAADVVLMPFAAGPYAGLAVVMAGVWTAHRLVTRIDSGEVRTGGVPAPWWDLPGRAAATGLLVLTVTGISAAVGPAVTGMLAPFPIATGVVAAFVLGGQGPAATIRTMAGVIRGLTGFAAFCFLLAILLGPFGVAGAFTAAVAGTLAVHLACRAVPVRRVPTTAPQGPART